MTMMTVATSIVCTSAIDREGLRRILDGDRFSVRQSVATADRLARYGDEKYHLVVIEQSVASHMAASVVAIAKTRCPEAKVVILYDTFDLRATLESFEAGVDGCLIKEISCEPLLCSLALVALGEKVMPSDMVSVLSQAVRRTPADDGRLASAKLSGRETVILNCLVEGLANKSISRRLSISEATVKVHVKAIMRKLDVQNRTQAAICAIAAAKRPIAIAQHKYPIVSDLHAVPLRQDG